MNTRGDKPSDLLEGEDRLRRKGKTHTECMQINVRSARAADQHKRGSGGGRTGALQINQLFGRDVDLDIRFQAALPFDPSGSPNPSIKALFGGQSCLADSPKEATPLPHGKIAIQLS